MCARPYTILPPSQMRAARVTRRRSGLLTFPVMASRRCSCLKDLLLAPTQPIFALASRQH